MSQSTPSTNEFLSALTPNERRRLSAAVKLYTEWLLDRHSHDDTDPSAEPSTSKEQPQKVLDSEKTAC